MLGLAIHTSSPQLGLMLQGIDGTDGTNQTISRHQVWDLGRDVSSHLHVKMMAFIKPYCWQDLSFVAVAKGPGGFTGTRVGVVAARTLAQQLEVPLFGVSSLAAVAKSSPQMIGKDAAKDIVVSMAAKREAVFGAVYRPADKDDLITVRADEALPLAAWAEILAQWEPPFVEITVAPNEGLASSVQGVMRLAIARYRRGDRPNWSDVLPFYGQHPVYR